MVAHLDSADIINLFVVILTQSEEKPSWRSVYLALYELKVVKFLLTNASNKKNQLISRPNVDVWQCRSAWVSSCFLLSIKYSIIMVVIFGER